MSLYNPFQDKFDVSVVSELTDGVLLELYLTVTKSQLRELGMSSPLDYGMMKFKELCGDRTISSIKVNIQ